jgi:hypothetical protein
MRDSFKVIYCIALTIAATWAMAAEPDGPYVLRGADGRYEALSVEVDSAGEHRRVAALKPGAVLTIPAVGAYPAFPVKLRPPAAPAPDTVAVPAKAPILVVADTHGEFEILAQMLTSQKVVDARLRWSFGRGHLVVLGDVFDRGPNQLEILWLLYSLEAQAAKAGGGVHFVLGNHELMALGGDARYLHPKYVDTARVLGVGEYAYLFPSDSVLGQWLRSRPAIIRVNDLLCLHGGVSRALLDRNLTLADINATVRRVLSGTASIADADQAQFLTTTLGPLWYRGYFAAPADMTGASAEDVDLTLARFGVKRILVGHTIVPTITSLYDGHVIAVQVYPRREAGHASFESLLIRGTQLFRALPDGTTQTLVPGGN